MIFNSYSFIFIFLPIAFIGFFLISRFNKTYGISWLGFVSLFFYSYWSLYSLPVLITSILMNFYFGKKINDVLTDNRKIVLITAITLNLALLSYFKYTNFFIDNLNIFFAKLDISTVNNLNIILPIGISFFTFTQIAYLIDTYYDNSKSYTFRNYLLFVTYFPHLVAGPIIHHKQVMPQFRDRKVFKLDYKKITVGLIIFIIGLSKKVIIADTIGLFVDDFYNNFNSIFKPDLILSWIGSLSYSIQLYFDFSGYSDMAIGLSLMFGVFLPFNFNAPYKSKSIIEFWQKWHMSLTKFIGQYLFLPLTLSLTRKYASENIYKNNLLTLILPLFITFFIIGIWHGANWTFAVYGLIHAFFMTINHLWRKRFFLKGIDTNNLVRIFYWLITFSSVVFSMVIFRSENVSTGINVYQGMLGLNGIEMDLPNIKLLIIIIFSMYLILCTKSTFIIVEDFFDNQKLKNIDYKNKIKKKITYYSILSGVLIFICLLQLSTPTTFLYYQF